MLAQVVALILGIWLLLAPGVFDYGGSASSVERIVGSVVIVVAALAIRDVTRPVRFVNVFTGLALLIAPWVFAYDLTPAIAVSALTGIALLGLALVRGRVSHHYAGGWSALWPRQTQQLQEACPEVDEELAPESHSESGQYASRRRYRMDASEAS